MKREFDITRILKRCVLISTTIGLLAGLLLGIAKALLLVEANRYVELGMYNIAFLYIRSILNESLLFTTIIAISIGIVVLIIRVIFLVFLKDRSKVNQLTLAIAVLLAIGVPWLLGGYFLNKASWCPRSTSFWGILFNLLFTLGCLIVGLLAYKILSVRYGSFVKLFNFNLVFALVILALVLNSYYYYNKFFGINEDINIVFITVDTLRADHLGYDGYERDTSPNIDELAKEGVVFSNALAQWPQTTPSIASMFTSTYGHTNGVVGDSSLQMRIDDYFVLLPEILKQNDYNTTGVVANSYLAPEFGFNQGIETYIETWKEDASDVGAETVTKKALSLLQAHYNKGKFFLWVHYIDPHARYTPPNPFNRTYVGDALYDETKRINLIPPNPSYPDIGGVREHARLRNNNLLDYYIAQYDGEIRYVDENIRILLNEIKKLGLYDKTLIIFTSDHGESLGGHNYFFWHGRFPYDDCLRVPFIIKFPSNAKIPSNRFSQPVGLIDLLPTILDFLNLPIMGETQGKTLMPLIRGEVKNGPKYVYSEAGYEDDYQRIIRTEKWKLIYIPDKSVQKIMNNMPFELYDIKNDPKEVNNLISLKTKIADELKKELFRWMDSTKTINGISLRKRVNVDREMSEKLRSLGYVQ